MVNKKTAIHAIEAIRHELCHERSCGGPEVSLLNEILADVQSGKESPDEALVRAQQIVAEARLGSH